MSRRGESESHGGESESPGGVSRMEGVIICSPIKCMALTIGTTGAWLMCAVLHYRGSAPVPSLLLRLPKLLAHAVCCQGQLCHVAGLPGLRHLGKNVVLKAIWQVY